MMLTHCGNNVRNRYSGCVFSVKDIVPVPLKTSRNQDLTDFLKEWPFNQQNNVRKVVGEKGAEKIQVRVDQGAFQGILQMEMDGRPDGKRPMGHTFVVDYYRNKLRKHLAGGKSEAAFSLTDKDCKTIFDESIRIYERYVFLLQIQDYARVIRDTERNMEVFQFVSQYALRKSDRMHLERWWPYILRMHAVARVMVEIHESNFDSALVIIREVRKRIEELDAMEFHTEKERSLKALEELAQEIEGKRPLSEKEKLEKELAEAVAQEEYERAAVIRDRLSDL